MKQPFYEIRREGPFTPMFENRKVHLGIGGLTLAVDAFSITRAQRTWVKEASHPEERMICDSLAGIMHGHGNVELSRTQGTLLVDGEEQALIPHGEFESLNELEKQANPGAEWKFTFDHTEAPEVHPM